MRPNGTVLHAACSFQHISHRPGTRQKQNGTTHTVDFTAVPLTVPTVGGVIQKVVVRTANSVLVGLVPTYSETYMSPRQRGSRGPVNALHVVAREGNIERMISLLSKGSGNVNHGDPEGITPLAYASFFGRSRMVRILLNGGASTSTVDDKGYTALHSAAQAGHRVVCEMLITAGAQLEATSAEGLTPLFLAALLGHAGVLSMLIEAGANPDNRDWHHGATPLYMAADRGHLDVTKLLLRAKANPLSGRMLQTMESSEFVLPLSVAAQNGHSQVVSELIQQVGIEGCAGDSGGLQSLLKAAMMGRLDAMAVLLDAGVVDTGQALAEAAKQGHESAVKLLLLQQERKASGEHLREGYYVGHQSVAVIYAVGFLGSSPSPRIVRLLVDARADVLSPSTISAGGRVLFQGNPLFLAARMLSDKKIGDKEATEEQLHRLERIRRLLMRVEAVHAISLLWPSKTPITAMRAPQTASSTKTTSASLRKMLTLLRRSTGARRTLMATVFRWALKYTV